MSSLHLSSYLSNGAIMKLMSHSLLFLLIFGFITAITEQAYAQQQCRSELFEIPWVIPPAIAGIDGDGEGTPGKVFIADRGGSIQVWNLTVLVGGLEQAVTLTPGNQLPSDVLGIWDIKVLKTGSIFALATYADQGTEWYGFLKSTDQGNSWEWVKPAAMQDPHFASLEGHFQTFGFTQVDFTGNYWRVALNEMVWLDDGIHGWVWGRKGIIRTTDGGATWSVAYKAQNENNQTLGQYKPVWGLAFQSPNIGAAVIGPTVGSEYNYSTDGGVTWTPQKSLAVNRLADLEYIGGEYRALTFNRTQRQKNTLVQISPNGQTWSTQPNLGSQVLNESVYASEAVWPSNSTGFFIQRQGEVWRTDDGGVVWEQMQDVDQNYDTVLYGDGTSIAGTGTPPFFPYAGYGQRTILLQDDIGDLYLINVLTDNCQGNIRGYIATWRVDALTSVKNKKVFSTLELQAVPNPVTEDLKVHFVLEHPGQTTASIVNASGVVVQTIDMGLLEAGKQAKLLTLSSIPSGFYQVVLNSGSERGIEAIVIEK